MVELYLDRTTLPEAHPGKVIVFSLFTHVTSITLEGLSVLLQIECRGSDLTSTTPTLIYLLANQMCPTYPTNQSDSLTIVKLNLKLRKYPQK